MGDAMASVVQRILFKAGTLCLALAGLGLPVLASDKIVIISPHRQSIQNEYIPAFKEWYQKKFSTDVNVEWLDQGGSNDDVKFLLAKFKTNPNTSGVDVFWGGGSTTHTEIANAKIADKIALPAPIASQVPTDLGGYTLRNKEGTYISQALSSFGIFFNRAILKLEKLPEPTTWEDLGNIRFRDKINLTDSRKSGTASIQNHIMLESLGWDKGMELLHRLAGNAKNFATTSSDPIKAIVSGDIVATPSIDFYALAKIGDLGADKLGFTLPEGKTIIEGDPITILKGAPNRKVADRFVEYIFSTEGQMLLMLPKGSPGGPKVNTLGRLAVNTEAYKLSEGKRVNTLNPFTAKGFLKYDSDSAAKVRKVLDDLLGATMIDCHKDLREAWGRVLKAGAKPADVAAFAKMPVTKDELTKLASQWDNATFRNEKLNAWVKFAKEKFTSVAK
jgi:ABC-type Fe3+ transport system substrate-binding protein